MITLKIHRGKRIFKVWSLFLDGVPFLPFFLFFIYFFIFYYYFFLLLSFFFIIIIFFLFFYFLFFIFYFLFFIFYFLFFIFYFFIFYFLFFIFLFNFLFFYLIFFIFYFSIFYFFIFYFFMFYFLFVFWWRHHPPHTPHPPLPLSFLPSPTHPSPLFFPLALPTIPEPLPTLAEARTSVTSASENMVARVPWRQTNELFLGYFLTWRHRLAADDFQQPIRSSHLTKIFPKICRRLSEDALHQSEARIQLRKIWSQGSHSTTGVDKTVWKSAASSAGFRSTLRFKLI